MRAAARLCPVLALLLPPLLACGSTEDRNEPVAAVAGIPAEAKETAVVRVTDGDTVVLEGLGPSRVIGVDAPEVRGEPECFGDEATAFAERALHPGAPVFYERGTEPVDRYGRDLVYLWLADGRFFNALLLERGYATLLTIPPNDGYADRFARLARDAKEHARGLWSSTTCGAR